jgi:hypothetical protein
LEASKPFYNTLSLIRINTRPVKNIFRFLALFLAGLHAWAAASSHSMNSDGISYLDIGDAYFRGDWTNAINPVWSPLYSWILGLANLVIKPSIEWEFPTVHLINFMIFGGTLVCFEFMWSGIRRSNIPEEKNNPFKMPDWLWWSLGYLLFIWTTLSLIQIWAVTPDMLMAAFVFLAAGLLARIRGGDTRLRIFLLLGLVLGLGYLSKTFMLSMALVFLGLIFFVAPFKKNIFLKTLLSIGLFLLISIPFIILISEKKGKLTIGEAGTVTYIRYVHGIPFPHWQGDPEKNIILDHPSRLIHHSPPIYEFAEPIGGSYPIAYDPSYWYDGIKLRSSFDGQFMRLLGSGIYYLDLFLLKQGMFFAGILALYMLGSWQKTSFLGVLRRWTLVIPALAAFGLYGLVLVADRYVGVFVLLFWADILANIKLPDSAGSQRMMKVLGLVAALGLAANILAFNLDGFKRLNPSVDLTPTSNAAYEPVQPLRVAEELIRLGVNEGDKVGVIGYGFDSFWARLARVKIAAEMLESQAEGFWYGDKAVQAGVLDAFASTGAAAVVAEYVPADALMDGWIQVDRDKAVQAGVLDAFASTGAAAVVAEYVPADALMDGWIQVEKSDYFIYLITD